MKKTIILGIVVVVVIALVFWYSSSSAEAAAKEQGLVWDPNTGKYVSDPDGFIGKQQTQGGGIGYDKNGNPTAWKLTANKLITDLFTNGNGWGNDVANVPLKYKPSAYSTLDEYLSALHSYFANTGKAWSGSTMQSATNYFNSFKK